MKPLRNILVPIHFRDGTSDIVAAAVALARPAECQVHLIHVLPPMPHAPLVLDLIRTKVSRRLQEAAEALQFRGVVTGGQILGCGRPSEQIMEHAARLKANLVVLGYGRDTGLIGSGLGHVAASVCRDADMDVCVVKPGARPRIGRILCPLDTSHLSTRAAVTAIHLARHLRARLFMLNAGAAQSPAALDAAAPPAAQAAPDAVAPPYDTAPENRPLRADEVCTYARLQGVLWETVLGHGRGAERDIVLTAEDVRPDLLVLGYEGRRSLASMLFGDLVYHVIPNVPCSVLLVKSGSFAGTLAPQARLFQEAAHAMAAFGPAPAATSPTFG